MLSQNTNSQKTYSEAQVTHWLLWLARGMQQHGQTIFLIENLQPSWLPERRERRLYVFCSSLLGGLMIGLLLTLATGFSIGSVAMLDHGLGKGLSDGLQGLIVGAILGMLFGVFLWLFKGVFDWTWLDQKRLWMRLRRLAIRWQTVIHVILTGLIVVLSYLLSLELTIAFVDWLDANHDYAFVSIDLDDWKLVAYIVGAIIGPIAILLWGIRTPHQTMSNDIKTVESLRWSWGRAFKSTIPIFVFTLFIFLITIGIIYFTPLIKPDYGGETISNMIVLSLFFVLIRAAFAGLKSELVEMKTMPNQGIRLSMQNTLLASGRIGLILGVGFTTISAIVLLIDGGDLDEIVSIALMAGILFGFSVGMFASTWYGGHDVVRHFILRTILYRKNYTPRRFAHFLDYAANDLNFLQKVGGGYIFIHRYLLEHFAAMAEEARTVKIQT